ncbi:hypothetical protein [Legionella lansingensis]|nr:hypothetical protein [Legionella lansingensis]
MQNIFLYYKGLNQFLEEKEVIYQLEFQAQQLAQKDWKRGEECLIGEQNPAQVIELLLSRGCLLAGEKAHYLYLVEELGIYPCLQTTLGEHAFGTRHLRINILSKEPKAGFLQLRVARPASLSACTKQPIHIPLGLLSWRYLSTAPMTLVT